MLRRQALAACHVCILRRHISSTCDVGMLCRHGQCSSWARFVDEAGIVACWHARHVDMICTTRIEPHARHDCTLGKTDPTRPDHMLRLLSSMLILAKNCIIDYPSHARCWVDMVQVGIPSALGMPDTFTMLGKEPHARSS